MTDLRNTIAHTRQGARAWRARSLEERLYLLTGWANTWLDPLTERPDATAPLGAGESPTTR